MSPRRLAFLLGVLLVAPFTAVAATLSLVADDLVYDPSDTISIRLVGDSEGGTDYSLFAMLAFDPAVLLDVEVQRYIPPPAEGDVAWAMGAVNSPFGSCSRPSGSGQCVLLNAIHLGGLAPSPVGVDPALEPFTYAVLTATAGASGVYNFEFVSTPTGSRLDFFGLTSAPGITITITGDVLPPVIPPPPDQPPPDQPPPPDTLPPPPPGGGETTDGGGDSSSAPVPEPSAAVLFAVGLAAIRSRHRGAHSQP